ncbi:transglutaminase family protein [Isosphaeraceae bacterium EP7]
MFYYAIRHVTRYRYSTPIGESVMEVRMQPRSEGSHRCWDFQLSSAPRAKVASYRDSLGNHVHHFDIPGRHTKLTITAESVVEIAPTPEPVGIGPEAWDALDALAESGREWEMLRPSKFSRSSPLLEEFALEINLCRGEDPWTTLLGLNKAIHEAFEYVPKSTRVDSPIDLVLEQRRGVCQDFAHVMAVLIRKLGIPCRYVSGYLFHRRGDEGERRAADATHAWVEAFLPGHGWVGLDPTNNTVASDRHVRVAIGRDYHDVPPTRGFYKGDSRSELSVSVEVSETDAPVDFDPPAPENWVAVETEAPDVTSLQQQQQQSQQEQQQQSLNGWRQSQSGSGKSQRQSQGR